MERPNSSDDHILMVAVPAILNLACFVQHAAGLTSYAGYHTGAQYHWPYHESGFRDAVDTVTFMDAAYQWPRWWDDLVNERHHVVTGNLEIPDEEWMHRGLPSSLDPYPALRKAVAMVWPTFWGWWLYPYVGGKMALESAVVNRQQLVYNKLQEMAPGRWHWDLVFCPIVQVMRYQAPYGWGVVHPNDFWRLDWMTPKTFA